MAKLDKDTENYLLNTWGFKKKWLDDKSGYWLEKKLKHKYLKDLRLVVDDSLGQVDLYVEASDAVEKNAPICLYTCKYSKQTLTKVKSHFCDNC